jgi:hypothetical protein
VIDRKPGRVSAFADQMLWNIVADEPLSSANLIQF